jgi:hypothetical protein
MVQFYDDLIDSEVSDEIYTYCQSISWYHKWYGLDMETDRCTRKLNEYIPSQDGNAVHRHILSQEAALHGLMQLLQFSSYRHPLGWNIFIQLPSTAVGLHIETIPLMIPGNTLTISINLV